MSLLDTASLLLTPNAYKEGKLYSVIPSDGSGDFTFTRATTATRVNADGLVELVPYNLLQYSEDFSNAFWNKGDTTVTTNTTTAPNGTITADKVAENTNTSFHFVSFATGLMSSTNNYTLTYYAKASERTWCSVYLYDGTNLYQTFFDLANGAIGTIGSGMTASIESVGNGWYRCRVSRNITGSVNANGGILTATGNNQSNYTGTSGSGIFIWGAQLELGSTALPYQKTETRLNIPRLDYSNGTCPSILLEPQRTNLLLQSSSFDSASWSKGGGSTVVANTTIAPDGTLTADTLNIPNNGNVSQAYNAPTNATRILTFYLKADSNVTVKIAFFTPSIVATCNLTTEWQRFEITHTWSGTVYPQIYNDSGSSVSIYAWGAQLEAGSYATSYIPTTTASVTRNLDSCFKTGATALIGQTEGTMFAEMKINSSSEFRVISISDNSVSNRVVFAVNGATELRGFVVYGNTVGTVITTPIPSGTIKIAVRYTATNYSFFVNGVLIGTQTKGAFTNPLITAANHQGNGGNSFYGFLNSFLLFQTPLTDAECIQLTTI